MVNEQFLSQQLSDGLADMRVTVTAEQLKQLMSYLQLLVKWNKAFNLTAVREPSEMVERHLLDSLSILPYVRGPHCIDVGSGAGLPGIPLAIMRPDLKITLLDSNGKKSRFQFQAVTALKLTQVNVVNERVEKYQPDRKFDQVMSRAFSSIQDMMQWTRHLGTDQGEWLAMKGIYPHDELQALPDDFRCSRVYPLDVPGSDGERHLVVLERSAD